MSEMIKMKWINVALILGVAVAIFGNVAMAGFIPVNGNDWIIKQISYNDYINKIGEAGQSSFVKVGYARYLVPNSTTLSETEKAYSFYPIVVRTPIENYVTTVIDVSADGTATGGNLTVSCSNPAISSNVTHTITLNLDNDTEWAGYKSKYFEINPYLWDAEGRDNAIIDCSVKSTNDDVNVYARNIYAYPHTPADIIFGRQVFCDLDNYAVIPNSEVGNFCNQNVTLSALTRVDNAMGDFLTVVFEVLKIVVKIGIIALAIFGLILLPLWALKMFKRMLYEVAK